MLTAPTLTANTRALFVLSSILSITYGHPFALALIAFSLSCSHSSASIRVEQHLIRNNDPFIQNAPKWTVTRYQSLPIFSINMDTLYFFSSLCSCSSILRSFASIFFFRAASRTEYQFRNLLYDSMCHFVCVLIHSVGFLPHIFLLIKWPFKVNFHIVKTSDAAHELQFTRVEYQRITCYHSSDWGQSIAFI